MRHSSKFLFVSLLMFSANGYPLEITPILGYRGGGEFVDEATNAKHTVVSSDMYGLIASWPYERGKTYELYYSHQSSDLNSINLSTSSADTVNIPLTIDYLHIGGTAPISRDGGDLKTFVSGGLGFTYMSPDFTGLESDLRASFSLGIGLKYPLANNIAFRLETRGLGTLFNSNSSIFCSGGCTLRVNGSVFFQAEIFAGIAIGF
jgi:opacity protein-like surface antigen